MSSVIKKLISQIIVFEYPTTLDYNTPGFLVDSREFFLSCKEVGCGNVVSMRLIGDFGIEFEVGVSEVVQCVAKLGVHETNTVNYCADYDIDELMKFIKISTVSPSLRIYLKEDMPAMMLAVTSLGTVVFYVRSRDMK